MLFPPARAFRPDFLLISCGLDGMCNNLPGTFGNSSQGFVGMTQTIVELARELRADRLVSLLERGHWLPE